VSTTSRGIVSALIVGLWLASILRAAPQEATPQHPRAVGAPSGDAAAMLNKYCVTCHNSRLKTAGLVLDAASLADVPAHAEVWEKVAWKLRTGTMPPVGMPRPDPATYSAFVSGLETALDRAAAAKPDPGRALLHRLNRAEYANSIRDLLAVDVDITSLLPADDSSSGFDNSADVLGVSPALLERYLSAAGKISALAVGDRETLGAARDETYRVPAGLTQTRHIDGLPLGTRGGLLVRHTFPLDGEYIIRPRLWATNNGVIRGLVEHQPHELEVTIDGERVHLLSIGAGGGRGAAAQAKESLSDRLPVRVSIQAGSRLVGVSFLQKTLADVPGLMQPFESALDPVDANGMPQLDAVVISGPFSPTGAGETPSRRRIFSCRPARAAEEASCAQRIITALGRNAYRRPASQAELRPLLALYQTGRQRGGFEHGIELALRRILMDPAFLFRAEHDPAAAPPGTVHRVDSFDLASRLSFFVWSSLPDGELLAAAGDGTLERPEILDKQVRRMLRDSRAEALVSNFAGQWLQLRNLKSLAPDQNEFPDFDDNLRQAFRRETELLFRSVMTEDRSVLDLLTADYTFVNERLAKHYGMPNVYGSQFRRVAVSDARRGLLGHGSMLMVTSRADRTSPVLRGKWILDNVLGIPPAPAPPNVPPLKDASDGQQPKTMREQLAEHRANPACAGCHKLMDPIGFALENFDAVGTWRTREAGGPIDASGGDAASGAAEAVRHVRAHHEREAADLCARPGIGLSRHAGAARNCQGLGSRQLSILVDHRSDCPQRAVSDAADAVNTGVDGRPSDSRPRERPARGIASESGFV
jgi:mono/diheme cytochrome c family protein